MGLLDRLWPPTKLDTIDAKLDRVITLLKASKLREEAMAVSNQNIVDEINSQETLLDGVLVAVQRLVAENDPAARQAIMDELKQNRAKTEAALLAGTPQEPPA